MSPAPRELFFKKCFCCKNLFSLEGRVPESQTDWWGGNTHPSRCPERPELSPVEPSGARIQDFTQVSHIRGRGPNTWVITHFFPRILLRSCIRRGAAGTWQTGTHMGTSIAGCDFLCYAAVLVPLTRDLRSRIHFLYSVYSTMDLRCAQPSFKSVIPLLSHSDWSHCRGKAMETSPSGNWENFTWPEDQMAMLPYTSMPLTQKWFYNTQHWLWHFPKETFSLPPKSCEMLGGSRVKV